MRILITGATGFIGRPVVQQLARRHEVFAATRQPSCASLPSNVQTVQCSLADPEAIAAVSKRLEVQTVLHLAWEGLPDYSLSRTLDNVRYSTTLVETLSRTGVKKIVIAGSCWELGEHWGMVDEDATPTNPGIFGIGKLSVKAFAERICRDFNSEMIWARLFYVYGPGQRREALIPSIHQSLQSNGNVQLKTPDATHDFVYVDDAAAALALLTSSEQVGSGTFNIGSGRPVSVGEIADLVAETLALRTSANESIAAQRGMIADISKIQSLGWSPSTDIRSGVQESVRALQRERMRSNTD
ncbi:MAG: NAD(P)-dependent oxidoreductase [Bdellovibrionales bacterium]|nr:NAD(P)-dependent oxidoreductase [Bdellovibrionales bacterium]